MDNPPIVRNHEYIYLIELYELFQLMGLQADRVRQATSEWGDYHFAATVGAALSAYRPGAVDLPTLLDNIREKTLRQGHVWTALDAFLAGWGRASLLLWPAPAPWRKEAEKERALARGAYLREVLEIDDTHPLNNRALRNDWEHYDERLDDALAAHGNVQPQRFVISIGGTENNESVTMRLVGMEDLRLVFAGERTYHLDELFEAATDLGERAPKAIFSLPARRHGG